MGLVTVQSLWAVIKLEIKRQQQSTAILWLVFQVPWPGGKTSAPSLALCAAVAAALGLAGLWADVAKGWSSDPAQDCCEAINSLALPTWHQLPWPVNSAGVPRMDWCLVLCSVHSQGTCCLGCLYLTHHMVFLCVGRLF